MIDQHANRPSEDELLAFVQGNLSEDAASRIHAAMATDKQLAADVAFMAGMKTAMLDASEAQTAPGEFGWRKLEAEMNRLDAN
jgi:anti-sigma factor RsiW